MDDNELARVVTRLLPADLIERLAAQHGLVTRRRTISIVPLVWCIVLATLATPNTSMAQWHRFLLGVTRWRLRARSSFYDRLSPQLTALLKDLLTRSLRAQRAQLTNWLEPALSGGFERVLAIDSSVVNLRDALSETWRACAHARSALKLHAVVNVLELQPHHLRLSSQTSHDLIGTSRIKQWARRKLILLDLGFYSFELFETIDQSGGWFVSRMKSSTNPIVVLDQTPGPGRFAKLEGLRVRFAAKHVKRKRLDLRVKLSNGMKCRLVGVRDEEDEWRWYLTNLSPQDYPCAQVAQLYRLRWQIELFFKVLKSQMSLDHQTSSKPHRVELKMWATLLGLVLSGRMCQRLRRFHPHEYSLGRGVEAMRTVAFELASMLCEPWRGTRSLAQLFEVLARDPNETRPRARAPLELCCDTTQLAGPAVLFA